MKLATAIMVLVILSGCSSPKVRQNFPDHIIKLSCRNGAVPTLTLRPRDWSEAFSYSSGSETLSIVIAYAFKGMTTVKDGTGSEKVADSYSFNISKTGKATAESATIVNYQGKQVIVYKTEDWEVTIEPKGED